jgi:large subunit ribosomal protein L10
MKRQEKTFFVQNLTEELKTAKSVILVNYAGLSVKMQQELKKRLKKADAKMLVVKNTLFRLAGKAAKIPEETLADTVLTGQTALIIAEDDPVSPLQILAKFAQEFEVPKLKIGIVEGIFQDEEKLIKLSKLPGKDTLIAQAVGTIASPLTGLVGTLEANMQKLVFILEQKSKKEQ